MIDLTITSILRLSIFSRDRALFSLAFDRNPSVLRQNHHTTQSSTDVSTSMSAAPPLRTDGTSQASDKCCPDCGSSGTLLECEGGCKKQLCSGSKCQANNPKICRYCSGRCCSACVNRYGPGLYLCKDCSSQICGR